EVKLRERKLDGNDDTDEQADDRPEDGGDRTIADRTIQVALIFIRTQRYGGRAIGGSPGYIAHQDQGAARECEEQNPHMGPESVVFAHGSAGQRGKSRQRQKNYLFSVFHLAFLG